MVRYVVQQFENSTETTAPTHPRQRATGARATPTTRSTTVNNNTEDMNEAVRIRFGQRIREMSDQELADWKAKPAGTIPAHQFITIRNEYARRNPRR